MCQTGDGKVCNCNDEEGKECTCGNHEEELKPQVSSCGGKDGECHCNDEKPAEPKEEMVASHSHHSHDSLTFGARLKPYRRLIATLIVVFVFGIVLSALIEFSWLSVMEYWMGGYFLAFGVMQALSLKKSAAMFRQYDLLAMKVRAYSYALPFIQIALGIAYFLMIWWLAIALVALFILLVNLFGVDRVMQQKQTVRCGCLGEGMNVPVGKVTLWENLIMIGMVVMMLTLNGFNYLLILSGASVDTMPGMNM